MELNVYRKQYPSRKTIIRLYPIGDLHNGTTAHDRNCLLRLLCQVKQDPFAIAILMGDMCEYISWHDMKRFDPNAVAKDLRHDMGHLIQRQTREVVELFEPIKNKIIGVHQGNHEYIWAKYHEYDPAEDIAERLGVPYLRFSAITHLIFERGFKKGSRKMFKLFSTHGAGGGRTLGGKIKRLEDLMRIARTDMYICGHSHKVAAFKETIFDTEYGGTTKKPILKKVEVAAAITGSFYKTYVENSTTYGERALYSPSAVGSICFEITPDKQEVNIKI